jgi:hypothetical protein
MLEDDDENCRCIPTLAVTSAVWIVQGKGEISKLGLVVNGIAMASSRPAPAMPNWPEKLMTD